MKGNNSSGFNMSSSAYKYFSMTGTIAAKGNIMSILYNDDFEDKYIIPCSDCYSYMFYRCSSLTTTPDLPAATLAESCYANMFRGCTELNHIKMLAADISARYCLSTWVSGVANNGTFIKHPNMTSLPTGISGIPNGWSVQDESI